MSGKRAKLERKLVRERVTVEDVAVERADTLMGEQSLSILTSGIDAVSVCERFISGHMYVNYGLTIYDILTNRIVVEIKCPVSEMGSILSYIYCLEHAEPIAWIAVNELLESYVVAMPLCRGRISGCYEAKAGKLKFIGEISQV